MPVRQRIWTPYEFPDSLAEIDSHRALMDLLTTGNVFFSWNPVGDGEVWLKRLSPNDVYLPHARRYPVIELRDTPLIFS